MSFSNCFFLVLDLEGRGKKLLEELILVKSAVRDCNVTLISCFPTSMDGKGEHEVWEWQDVLSVCTRRMYVWMECRHAAAGCGDVVYGGGGDLWKNMHHIYLETVCPRGQIIILERITALPRSLKNFCPGLPTTLIGNLSRDLTGLSFHQDSNTWGTFLSGYPIALHLLFFCEL
ncbi:hypothetical protein BDD12DRAFT_497201 [Trichophaea hybrida]|nr:hypothetical protein BDD12DRAFT_497201 [Trichophaea hybrida]